MLLQVLDEDIFATEDIANTRIREFETGGINKFFIRRLKEDMKDWNDKPLFKERFTKTTPYELTPEEKDLYNEVTSYLTTKKAEASQSKNIHVSLALSVMQRRLVSSIFAIKNTLERRFNALQSIVDEVKRNPNLWNQRHKLETLDVATIDDYDELEDDERDALENILSDPKKFKLFTTARNQQEIQSEADQVKKLFLMADTLYNSQQEERKFTKLRELLTSQNVIDHEKLVLFTEHKDTLLYLEERLKNSSYQVVTIHGGKSVDERRQAQWDFAKPETQILLASDAAGEGINLQFCRLLINWDMPWNPNRLEQRMGRIHRYGQKKDVLVFNMVASNTKEGQVLERLLLKLDIIRESLGDDRVYDVIQDVLEEVRLGDIMDSVFNGKKTAYDDAVDQPIDQLKQKISEKIHSQREKLSHSTIDYQAARELKESSDEKRLQPIYVRLFFEKAFRFLGGDFSETRKAIFRIERLPEMISEVLRKDYNIFADNIRRLQFCFDKQVFLDYQAIGDLGPVHYINPGNALFDSVINVIRQTCREDMLKGTILVSPDDKEDYLAFFVKSQITDNRPSKQKESITDEQLLLVQQNQNGEFHKTSPAFKVLVNPSEDVPEQQKLTLIILHPSHLFGSNGLTKPTIELIQKLATKKGNSERIYRNTILFLVASEAVTGKLSSDAKDYLACQQISADYGTQLEPDQKIDLKRKIDDANKGVDSSLVIAYSTVVKYSVRNGPELLAIKQFRDSLDAQLNSNLVTALKEEEWLLESVGLGTLRSNNLLPTPERSIKAKDIYEAFLRFDDKPKITSFEAVQRSLLKYCFEGNYCIASGDGKVFTKYYLRENVPFFDVQDVNYWLLDQSLKPVEVPVIPPENKSNETMVAPQSAGGEVEKITDPTEKTTREFKSITISGKVPLERYSELFNYFISPFAMSGSKIEIQVSFKISSTESNPLTESKQQYKSAKEAAKQLGLNLSEEEK